MVSALTPALVAAAGVAPPTLLAVSDCTTAPTATKAPKPKMSRHFAVYVLPARADASSARACSTTAAEARLRESLHGPAGRRKLTDPIRMKERGG